MSLFKNINRFFIYVLSFERAQGLHFVETNSEPPFARGHINEQSESQGRSGTENEYFSDFK